MRYKKNGADLFMHYFWKTFAVVVYSSMIDDCGSRGLVKATKVGMKN